MCIDNNFPLLEMEYAPSILDEKEIGTLDKISLATISAFGGSLATLPTSLRTITETVTTSGDGLYKAVFPEGVVGKMSKFKGIDAYTGNIQGADGIAGRIRWVDAGDVTSKVKTTIPYDPTMIFMGVAIATIEKQLRDVKESQALLLEMEEIENRTQMIGDLQFLNEIKENFKYNWDNEVYLRENYGQILTIRREAKRKVFYYQELIKHENDRKDLIHTDVDVKKKMKQLAINFQNYQLARYIHSYSYLLEVLTQHNYNENYLTSIVEEIRSYALAFRELFTYTYDKLANSADDSLETLFLNYASKTNDKLGKVLESIPGIKNLEVGDNLQKMGEKLLDVKANKNAHLMEKFISEKSNEIIPFIETIEKLNEYHNKPQAIYFDRENVYIK